MNTSPAEKETLLVQIAADDLGPLLVDRLRISPGPASPFRDLLADYRPDSGALSEAGAALTANLELGVMVRVLADPALVVIAQEGGGPLVPVRRVTCHAPRHGGEFFVTVSAREDGGVLLECDGSPWLFLARWIRRIAGHPVSGVPNRISPPTTPVELALLLHTVDLQRRVQLENLLDPVGHPETSGIPAGRLVPALLEAFEFRDPRWLLGAWLSMAPDTGLEDAEFDDPEVLDVLARRGFLLPADPEQPDGLLLFGEPAVEMGTEFMLSWSGGCGFQYSAVRDGRLEPLAGAFLATTGLTHHLFLRHNEPGRERLAVHQTLDRDEFDAFMARTLKTALEAAEAPVPVVQPAHRTCPQCGEQVPPGARFCGHCGHPVA